MDSKYDVFISGETIDLCVPSQKAIIEGGWYNWFNDMDTTKHLNQGIYPNTPENQQEFYEENVKNKKRLILMIKSKDQAELMGTVSFSNIDMSIRKAFLAIVIGVPSRQSSYQALEAMCLMTEHAFERMGLECVQVSTVYGLKGWFQRLELFGYGIEGIQRKAFRKGHNAQDVILMSCILEDYLKLKEQRNGHLWPGRQKLERMLAALPKKYVSEELKDWLNKKRSEAFSSLFTRA